MAHVQKPDFIFRRNGWVHLNQRGSQFSWLLAAEVYASEVVMLDTPCSEVVWRVLATQSIRQFPLHFPSCASPCAITFQLDSNTILYYTCYDSDGLTMTNTGGNMVPYNKPIIVHIIVLMVFKPLLFPNNTSGCLTKNSARNLQFLKKRA